MPTSLVMKMMHWHFPNFSVFEGELLDANIPVVHTSLAGCRIIGRMCAGKLLYHYQLIFLLLVL